MTTTAAKRTAAEILQQQKRDHAPNGIAINTANVRTQQWSRSPQRKAKRATANSVMAEMCRGQALHLHHDRVRGEVWSLTPSGREVATNVARQVIKNPDVVDCGGSLFANAHGQIFRLVDDFVR
jgi:hypothetical protein